MLPLLKTSSTLWCAWTAVGTTLLFANPWIPFSWPELVACLGALVLGLDRKTRRETLLAVGLPAIALLALVDGGAFVVPRLVGDWIVFIGSVMLASAALEDQLVLERRVGRVLFASDPDEAFAEIAGAAEIELARSRRHERSFGMLSIAPHPRELTRSDESAGRILQKLAEAQHTQDLASVVRDEVHRYATIAATSERVLCIVPELEAADAEALITRIAKSADVELQLDTEIGLALFPADALTFDDLVDVADQRRRAGRLESVAKPLDADDEAVSMRRAEHRD